MITRESVVQMINAVLTRQGHAPMAGEQQTLREASFRSLDFSEVALRVETEIDRELNYEAAQLRGLQTMKDVIDFLVKAAA